jgi:hypothetical protein
MIRLTKTFALFTAITSLFGSLIWGICLHEERWFSRIALSMAMFAAYGIMIRLDEILKHQKK